MAFIGEVIALIGGALGGLITGLLMTKFRIPPLLAGILTMTGLYSINLRIMGRSNISLLNHPRVTQLLNDIFPLDGQFSSVSSTGRALGFSLIIFV